MSLYATHFIGTSKNQKYTKTGLFKCNWIETETNKLEYLICLMLIFKMVLDRRTGFMESYQKQYIFFCFSLVSSAKIQFYTRNEQDFDYFQFLEALKCISNLSLLAHLSEYIAFNGILLFFICSVVLLFFHIIYFCDVWFWIYFGS